MTNNLVKANIKTVAQLMETHKASIAKAIPKHVTIDRLMRVALSELRTNEKLAECEPLSLMSSISKAAQLGLEVGSALGHAYLVPYKREAQLIIGYRGYIALARRSGEIQSLTARVVREHDVFELEYGLHEQLRHVPSTDPEPGEMTHVYAIARLKDGGIQYEVMTKADVDAIRARSKAAQYGPWVTDYHEMARKTVVRRLFKYLPVSVEIADAITAEQDEMIDVTPRAETADTIDQLNAIGRGPVTLEHNAEQEAMKASSWPMKTEAGWVDARGIRFNDECHATSSDGTPAVTNEGNFRKRRGRDDTAWNKAELARISGENNEAPDESETDQSDEQLSIDSIVDAMNNAETGDSMEELMDYARQFEAPEERAEIGKAYQRNLRRLGLALPAAGGDME